MEANELVDAITQRFVDEGKLIEAGWQAYRIVAIPPDAPDIQISECRLAFFFGAQHLFASVMGFLDDGEEPTEDDLQRLTLVSNELSRFIAKVKETGNGR